MEVLCIIPARGGSKGLPGKNIRPLLGHPLIAYSVRAALDSRLVMRTIVSTDDEDIAAVCRDYGAETPFMRPAEFAQDLSTDLDVFTHALGWLREHEDYVPDLVVQLRPTSPVRLRGMIDACIQKVIDTPSADSLRIVTPTLATPYKMWRVADEDRPMTPLLTADGLAEPFNQPRQILPKVYWQIGTLDVIRASLIAERGSMSGETILPHIVDNSLAVDIDTLADFEKAAEVIARQDCIKFA